MNCSPHCGNEMVNLLGRHSGINRQVDMLLEPAFLSDRALAKGMSLGANFGQQVDGKIAIRHSNAFFFNQNADNFFFLNIIVCFLWLIEENVEMINVIIASGAV